MKSRLPTALLLGTGLLMFVAAVTWPTISLVGRCITDNRAPDGGFTFSARQLELLLRSAGLSCLAVVLCLVISLPAIIVIGRLRRPSTRPLLIAVFTGVLLCPPMVYAFGWDRVLSAPAFAPGSNTVLPESINDAEVERKTAPPTVAPPGADSPNVNPPDAYPLPAASPRGLRTMLQGAPRCVLVWALWAWPIPALLIGAGWSRSGRSAMEAARLVTSSSTAFIHVALPVLARYIALSALVLFVLFFNDYGVPHACGMIVFATELLGWASSSTHPIDTLWPSTLSLIVTLAAIAAVVIIRRRCVRDDAGDVAIERTVDPARGLTIVVLSIACVSWLVPLAALATDIPGPRVFMHAMNVYGKDVAWSLGVAGISGLAAVAMGLGLVGLTRFRLTGAVWAVLFGTLPGALIGTALVSAYNHSALSWIYDGWPIIALSYVARFGWIGVFAAMLATESTSPDLIAQARTDGATRSAILGRIQIAISWPALLCGAFVVMALSIADVATSSLVRVPGFSPIAHILIEKFHRFEDGMLISLSLTLVLSTLPPALLLAIALRRRQQG